jgi:hypothetical protein
MYESKTDTQDDLYNPFESVVDEELYDLGEDEVVEEEMKGIIKDPFIVGTYNAYQSKVYTAAIDRLKNQQRMLRKFGNHPNKIIRVLTIVSGLILIFFFVPMVLSGVCKSVYMSRVSVQWKESFSEFSGMFSAIILLILLYTFKKKNKL